MKKGKKRRDTWHLPDCIRKKLFEYRDIPDIFADRVLKMSILSFLILLLGIFMGRQMESPGFILWSVILSIVIFVQALCLLYTALAGRYEVVEGTVLEITGRMPVGKFQKIKIGFTDGTGTELLLEKNIRIERGSRYRFYFSCGQNALSGIKTVDAALSTGSFFGLEKLGKG